MGITSVKNNKNSDERSIESLIIEVNSIAKECLDDKLDIKSLTKDEKGKLRSKCYNGIKICNLALEFIATDINESNQNKKLFEDYIQKFNKKMKDLGSTISHTIPTTTFDDVKGLDDVKKIVKSFIYMANNQQITDYYHIKGGLGMLMYGAPGTGKTMFAEAIANELKLPLFVVTPADIFKSEVGASEESVRKLFEEIDSYSDGAILFVDECESIFTKRSSKSADYKTSVTTELLQRMNGFGVNGAKRIMIAATNRPELIDEAYLRYKRFSHIVHITPPDYDAIKSIVSSKLKGIAVEGISIEEITNMAATPVEYQDTPFGPIEMRAGYYSAADICGIIEEASRNALEIMQAREYPYPIALTRDMFVRAFKKIPPSISVRLLKEYNNFKEKE